MVVLLAVTGLAVVAVQSTSYELRAAGHERQAMQAEYVAKAGIEATFSLLDNPSYGPAGLDRAIRQTSQDPTYAVPSLAPFEPDVLADKDAYRLYSENYVNFGGVAPTEAAAIGALAGNRQPYNPSFEVDVYDYMLWNPLFGTAGNSAASSTLRTTRATYTSRGRMRLRGGDFTGTDAVDPRRQYHETAHAARAYAVSGPF
jgi:hypothetical protein